MKKILRNITVIAILLTGFLLAPVYSVYAAPKDKVTSGMDKTGTSGGPDFNTLVSRIVGTILLIVGILSVVMIIYGGIKYTTSAGDSSKMTSAKNTITYAIVGLIVSMTAYAIVTFVVGKLG